MGDLRHPVARLFVSTLTRIARAMFRSTPDSPMVLLIDRFLAEAPSRMLPMITQGRLGSRSARALVTIANRWALPGRRPRIPGPPS